MNELNELNELNEWIEWMNELNELNESLNELNELNEWIEWIELNWMNWMNWMNQKWIRNESEMNHWIVLHPIDSLISFSFPSFLHPEIVQHVLHFFLHSVDPHSASPIETHPISTSSFPRFPFFTPSPRTISLFNGTQSVPLLQVSVSTVSPFHVGNYVG